MRTRLVLDELADEQQVTVSDAELTERIIMQAQQYRMPPEEFVRRIQEAGQLGAIYADVRRTKALIAAVRAATVTDATGAPVDLSDLLAQNQEDDADGPVAVPVDTAPVESTVDADEEAAPTAEAAAEPSRTS